MSDKNNDNDDTTDSEGTIELRDAQQRIRDAYFDSESGLYVLNCNPGAGKSVTITYIAAEELLRRYVSGNPTPEQHLCVVSFTRDDAATFVPTIIQRLRELAEYDLTPAAAAVSSDDIEYLADRVRQAPLFGTVDSIFRRLLGEFVSDIGFTEMPDIGNDGQLTRLHADCYDEVASNPSCSTAIDIVEAAYPPDKYENGPTDLLRQAHHHCRARRLTVEEFIAELRETVEAVYKEGKPTSFDDVAAALARCLGADAADEARQSLDDTDREDVVVADQQLHTAWIETIDAFETLLNEYSKTYRRLSRDRGIISHTDCAFLVAEFLSGNLGTSDTAPKKRERVLDRYRNRLKSVIIDESQDISRLQHEALGHLVTDDCRVLAAGDLQQSVYVWREAHPELFQRAVEEGCYLDIDWDTHVVETAATTYRSTPDIAAAVNAIAEPVLTDPTRGDIGSLEVTYPRLNAARKPNSGASVHIAAFDTDAVPGSIPYIAPDSGKGEAGILATYLSRGLADGTLDNTDNEDETADKSEQSDPDVTVLFRWRTHMERYRNAFESEGLTVADASKYLFECPAVTAAIDVVEWLADPVDTDRTRALVTESTLGLASLEATFETHDWQLNAVRDDLPGEVSDEQRDVLDRLHTLQKQHAPLQRQSAANILNDIIDTLALRADPNDIASTGASAQRVANLDRFVELVKQWMVESLSTLDDLADVLTQYRDEPYIGPIQPVHTDDHDVVFRTIHQMKGDESDVVALADIAFPLRKHGPVSQRFVASGPTLGLAPPKYAAATEIESLPGYTHGLYDTDRDNTRFGSILYPYETGMRWASENWTDKIGSDSTAPTLAGHDRLQTASRLTRAEAWRLLFVALSRARNHLVVPLPRNIPGHEHRRDRWLEPIREGLGFDGTPSAGTYCLDVEQPNGRTRSIDIAVNDVETLNTQPTDDELPTQPALATTTPPAEEDLPGLVPRILRPSTLYPLSEDFEQNILDHLQGNPLHTETETVDDNLPLTLDEFDTEDVGAFVHSVLTRCVDQAVSADELRTRSPTVEQIIDGALHNYGPPANEAERNGLVEFLTQFVLPDVATSELWKQLEHADSVIVEKPLRGHVNCSGVEFEIEGQADILLEHPDGSWTIVDTKIALTDVNTETQHRYETQVSCYATLLNEEHGVEGPITCVIETFGAVTDRYEIQSSSSELQKRLEMLIHGGK